MCPLDPVRRGSPQESSRLGSTKGWGCRDKDLVQFFVFITPKDNFSGGTVVREWARWERTVVASEAQGIGRIEVHESSLPPPFPRVLLQRK